MMTNSNPKIAQILARDWHSRKKGTELIDLNGKKVHLFQLPPTIPERCFKNIKLPSLKHNRSKAVTIKDNSTEQNQEWTVMLSATEMSQDFTLMNYGGGNVQITSVQPTTLIQGVIQNTDEDSELVVEPHSKHVLPDGLRQRFIPYGVTMPASPKKSPRKRHAAERQISVLSPDFDQPPPSKKRKKSKKSKRVREESE